MKKIALLLMIFVASHAANLTVTITDVKNSHGQILVGLFANQAQYEVKNNGGGVGIYVDAKAPMTTYTFYDLAEGEYAVTLFHDENSNKKLDFHFLGYPIEGYSFSNNIRPLFRGARYEEAKFRVAGEDTTIEIEMRY